ncbi:alpha/beta hydrolase [Nocardiopsis sp. EMB25]|uniref:alpha/beta fold hydrolase n=1 Tax=Nocardiopsis TaxID=2013 RepID=UPI00036F941A|nr:MULTISPECIES: alpha/beta fold hydrolase [Nocardiopsis]MCY9786366.1 alpha/beta hydrolase [Nocardiopsis sp. EMB25]
MALIPLQYRLDGPRHAPVVLLVPPFGTTMSVWDAQLPALTRDHQVLRINHRGHGFSPAPEGPYTIADMALDVLRVLEERGFPRVSAVGAGFGSSLLVWIAANSPRTLDRLALLAAAPRTPPSHHWGRIAAKVRSGGLAAVADEVALPWFTPDMLEDRPEDVERFEEALGRLDPGAFASVCDAVAAMDQRNLVAAVRAPTLVVTGAHDPLLPPGHGRRLADGIVDSRFEVVAGAAHLVGVERPEPVNELVTEHLTRWRPGSVV